MASQLQVQKSQPTKDIPSATKETPLYQLYKLHSTRKMKSQLYKTPSSQPPTTRLHLRAYASHHSGVASGNAPASVSFEMPILLNYVDNVNWQEFSEQVARYGSIRFNGVTTRILVNNPYVLVQQVGGTPATALSTDWEFLRNSEVHCMRKDFVGDLENNPDFFTITKAKHAKTGQILTNTIHVAAGYGGGHRWHPRATMFTDSELKANGAPNFGISTYFSRQTTLPQAEIAANIPPSYIVAVTGFPDIQPPQDTSITTRKTYGFQISAYYDWSFDVKGILPLDI